MRVATWNMKQAVAPKKPLPKLWSWMESTVRPNVIALTEARVPKGGLPPGWSALWQPGGIGPRRTWGTVLAARGVELRKVTSVKVGRRQHELTPRWPATTVVADVMSRGERWATVIGLYGLTVRLDDTSCGHGRHSTPQLLRDLGALFESDRADRIVLAGDLNLWPCDKPRALGELGLFDLIDETSKTRQPLERCSGCTRGDRCGHLWTHRNGNSPGAAVQQIDYIFASRSLRRELVGVTGGVGDFPDAWDVSDHAPVVADFR